VSASDMERLDVRKCDTLPQMLPQVDVLSIHAPLVPSTRHIIAGREIALMKRSAILINTSRGGLVDEVALAAALNEGKIAGAGVDVFEVEPPPRDNPLFTARNIVLTPHISGGTDSAFVALAVGSATAVLDVLSGKKPRYLINPEVLGRTRAKLPA
jgi:D-3-phosphoglycerate dehydrogenase